MSEVDPDWLDRQQLTKIRGFLLYVACTYRHITPFLKGLHLTIDGGQPMRDVEGWKRTERDLTLEL